MVTCDKILQSYLGIINDVPDARLVSSRNVCI
jgi:hypothetical protein